MAANMMMANTTWRPLWQMAFGTFPVEEFFTPMGGSLLYLTITILSGFILRALSKVILHPVISEYVCDFLATMEMCAYFYENNFIFSHFGPVWLFVAVVIECIIANRTYFGASENPVKSLYSLCMREIGPIKAVLKIAVQTLAGLASYKFARLVWSLDMVPDHRERYFETSCVTDLNVTLLAGMGIELAATLIDTWLGMQIVMRNSFIDELIKVGNGALMIVVGISTTGMYFNPAMATGHLLGCKGASNQDHLIVYWVGPFIGCIIALLFDRVLHIDVTKPKAVATEKKKQ
ncbi:aquaporin-11-like [Pecten maximus]|uniref:aquaporin-11-like n=1 Tax=Pecten maximus TaxID=6579 RepID=UPI0014588CEF|nr:aquaporin-11-like [Pecten maximus]